MKFTIHVKNKGPITPLRHEPLSSHHVDYFDVSQINLKKDPIKPCRFVPLSRHHANYFAISRITT